MAVEVQERIALPISECQFPSADFRVPIRKTLKSAKWRMERKRRAQHLKEEVHLGLKHAHHHRFSN